MIQQDDSANKTDRNQNNDVALLMTISHLHRQMFLTAIQQYHRMRNQLRPKTQIQIKYTHIVGSQSSTNSKIINNRTLPIWQIKWYITPSKQTPPSTIVPQKLIICLIRPQVTRCINSEKQQ